MPWPKEDKIRPTGSDIVHHHLSSQHAIKASKSAPIALLKRAECRSPPPVHPAPLPPAAPAQRRTLTRATARSSGCPSPRPHTSSSPRRARPRRRGSPATP
eukprot:1984375-Prymnesium_polylepis.1